MMINKVCTNQKTNHQTAQHNRQNERNIGPFYLAQCTIHPTHRIVCWVSVTTIIPAHLCTWNKG